MQVEKYINKNKIIGVVGNSGSGKTTFIKNFIPSKNIGIVNNEIIKESIVNDQIEYYVRKYNYRFP